MSSIYSETPLINIFGAVRGGIAVLRMAVAIGGLWIWIKKRRTTNPIRGTERSEPELSIANAGSSSPLHYERLHDIHGCNKGANELPASGRYELLGNDGAREMPTLD